jgi:hypothetical protein
MTNAPTRAPLFPIMAKPSDGSPIERPASDRTADGEQKNDARTVPATRQRVRTAFRAEIGMMKLIAASMNSGSWRKGIPTD